MDPSEPDDEVPVELELVEELEDESESLADWDHQEKGNILLKGLRQLIILLQAFRDYFFSNVLLKIFKSHLKQTESKLQVVVK